MEQTKTIAFALLRYTLCGVEIPLAVREQITQVRLENVYRLSKSHDLAHLVADALDKNGLLDDSEISNKFRAERVLAVYRYEQMQYELDAICKTLEEEKIEHIPLKGSVLRKYYPEPWMRTSCDIDILVHEIDLEAAVKLLTGKLKYRVGDKDAHDISLFSPGGVHLELHFKLVDARVSRRGEQFLTDIWNNCDKINGLTHQRMITDETFYFYHVAHMAKHFELGGCGIRSFIDLWILNHRVQFEREKREKLLADGELLRFDTLAQKLAEVWLSQAGYDERTKTMEDYVLRGGAYGTLENGVTVKQAKKKGKFGYLLSRIFISYEALVVLYPSLKKRKCLFPFYQIRRWFRLLLKGKTRSALKELKVGADVSKKQKKEVKKLLQDLGL